MSERGGSERAESTRTRLMEAATAAFAEKGFAGTTTRDIAAAAGMSPAALYVHHSSKEELLYLISLAGHRDTLRTVRDAIGSSDDPAEALHTLVYEFALHHARGRRWARIVNYELGALSSEHLEQIRGLRRETEAQVRGLVERGVRAGVFRTEDPRMAAVMLLSLGIDIARWFREDRRWAPEDVARGYAAAALRIVGA